MTLHGIDLDAPQIQQFRHRWKITELNVFGSILTDQFGPDSDIDMLVDYEPDAEWDLFDEMHMHDELERILGRRVDIVDRFAIEHDGNRFLRSEILSTMESVDACR